MCFYPRGLGRRSWLLWVPVRTPVSVDTALPVEGPSRCSALHKTRVSHFCTGSPMSFQGHTKTGNCLLRPLPSPSQRLHVIPHLHSRAQHPERTSQKPAGNSASHCPCPGPKPKRCKATGAADLRDICVPSSGQTVPICHL